eukprot:6479832-Amphidinium_carterae.1
MRNAATSLCQAGIDCAEGCLLVDHGHDLLQPVHLPPVSRITKESLSRMWDTSQVFQSHSFSSKRTKGKKSTDSCLCASLRDPCGTFLWELCSTGGLERAGERVDSAPKQQCMRREAEKQQIAQLHCTTLRPFRCGVLGSLNPSVTLRWYIEPSHLFQRMHVWASKPSSVRCCTVPTLTNT